MSGVFELLLGDTESLWERVTVLAEAKWSPEQVNAVVLVVQRAEEALVAANDCLDELPEAPVEKSDKLQEVSKQQAGKAKNKAVQKQKSKKKRARDAEEAVRRQESGEPGRSQRVKKKSTKLVEMETVADKHRKDGSGRDKEDDEEEAEDEEPLSGKKRQSTRMEKSKKAESKKDPVKLRDGMVGKVSLAGSESLVYFSLGNEENKGLFDCPSLARLTVEELEEQNDDEEENAVALTGSLSLKRSVIEPLLYGDLITRREKLWYQQQVEQDILKRFEVNFPVLFANQGCDLLEIKTDLLSDPSQTADLIERLAQKAYAVKNVSVASPKLSAANNSALMVASVLHKNLSESGKRGWYKTFQELVKDMCERCDLTRCDLAASTVERLRKVGSLMLRSDVVACLLPSFVWAVEDAVEALLDDEAAARRLEGAFNAMLESYFAELRDSSALKQLGEKKRALELNGIVSPLELQVDGMLNESGQEEGGFVPLPEAVRSERANGLAHLRTCKGTLKRRK